MKVVAAGRFFQGSAVRDELKGFKYRCRVVASRHVSQALAVSTYGVGAINLVHGGVLCRVILEIPRVLSSGGTMER